MVTMSLFALLAAAAAVGVKWGPLSLLQLVFGLFVGLAMADTTMGPPVRDAVEGLLQMLADTAGKVEQ